MKTACAVLACVLLTGALPARGAEPGAITVSVEGVPNGKGGLQLSVEMLGFDLGAKVYSEPSHTLMLAVLSHEFEKSERAKATLVELAGSRGVAVTTDPRETAPRVHVPARPASDERVSVWAIAEGTEVLIADTKVSADRFVFSSTLAGGIWTHCCSSPGTCGPSCTDCSTGCNLCSNPECGWVKCP